MSRKDNHSYYWIYPFSKYLLYYLSIHEPMWHSSVSWSSFEFVSVSLHYFYYSVQNCGISEFHIYAPRDDNFFVPLVLIMGGHTEIEDWIYCPEIDDSRYVQRSMICIYCPKIEDPSYIFRLKFCYTVPASTLYCTEIDEGCVTIVLYCYEPSSTSGLSA